jgi:hypothetical protein
MRAGQVQVDHAGTRTNPHRPMVEQAIGQVRAERTLAQEREAQRLRDEITRQAREQKPSLVHGCGR